MAALKEPNAAGYEGDPNDALAELGIDALRKLAEEAYAVQPGDDPGHGAGDPGPGNSEYDEAGDRFDEPPPNEGEQGAEENGVAELPDGYRYNDGTIEYATTDEEGNTIWHFLCSAVEFRAVTRNPEGKGWGLALRIITQDGKWNSLTVTQAMTVDTKGFFAALYDHGFNIPPGKRGLVYAPCIPCGPQCNQTHVLRAPCRLARAG